MKEVYWGYWLIVLGVFITIVMMLISNVTTSSTQDYYLIKEVTEAAMLDAVDLATYRDTGNLKINQEKFVESFLRRFSENVSISKTYQIDFYDLNNRPLILQKEESNSRKFLDYIALENNVKLLPKMEVVSQELITEFVNIGLGIGFVIIDLANSF